MLAVSGRILERTRRQYPLLERISGSLSVLDSPPPEENAEAPSNSFTDPRSHIVRHSRRYTRQVMQSMAVLPEDERLQELDERLKMEIKEVEDKAAVAASRKSQSVLKKKVKHGGKVFRDLVDEMTIHLVEQDMDEAGEIARRKAEAEHEVLRRIMAMWIGLGMRERFAEWKTWYRSRARQRKRDARKALREAWQEYESQAVIGVMAEWKRSFWIERLDVYTDSPCWVHKTTGETRTHPPVTEEFIPQGYTIPEPPSRRLEEMTSTSSSSDSDSDESSSGTVRDDSERSESLGVSDGRSTAGTSIVSDSASESDGDESSGSASSPEKLDSDDDMDHSGDGTPSGTASSDTYASSDSSSGDEDRSSSSRDVSRSSGSSSTNTSSSSSRKTTSSSVSVDDKVGTSRQATRALVIAKERALSGNVPSLIKEEARGTHAIVENGPDGTDEITRRDTGKTLAALSDETRDVDVVGSPRRRGSERPSSRRSSSIRTEKSLDRQKEWEIEHARVRARRCRKQLVEKIRREENERRAMAKENREKLEASGPPIPTVQEIMSTVGWDSEKTYSTGELHQFATATRDKMCDFGLDSNLDEHFSDFRTKPF